MSRLSEILLRRPPVVAPPELLGRPFGFAAESDPEGWTVVGYGPDGRRLGRPLKGVSDPALTSLSTYPERTTDDAQLRALAAAWVTACRSSVTNGQALTALGDAAERVLGSTA